MNILLAILPGQYSKQLQVFGISMDEPNCNSEQGSSRLASII